MAWEEEKPGWCLGGPCQGCRAQKGVQAPDGVSGLRHSRVVPLPVPGGSVWGEAENRWDGGEGLAWRTDVSCMAWGSGWIPLYSLLCLLQKDPGFDRGQFHKQIAVMRGQVSCV